MLQGLHVVNLCDINSHFGVYLLKQFKCNIIISWYDKSRLSA